ncbi:MAG TPA: hypothetical protein VJT49_30930 [Amycolatopsis sp.]|uniref:hypothetical protein n=1 Tax=Amycolatopsis sp. TaxID=37632 RepID=UPI002B46509D|nr:hypothetical protein [Amycolatopsis sp.]HKS49448.1 hypothetical protein [Amycolatopsis sp.]
MRVVHDRRRIRRSPDTLTVDDLLAMEALDRELPGGDCLTTMREPRKFLPPPRVRARRQAVPPREPESRLAKVAKLAGLTTAASMLVGAVVASSMVTNARMEQTSRANPVPPPITGAAALGAFAPQGDGRAHAQPAPSTSSKAQLPVTQTKSVQPDSTQPAGKSPAPADEAEKLSAVKEFYRLLGSPHPEQALRMLAPSLSGDSSGELVRAWGTMSRVEVNDAHLQQDGSVLAVVTVVQRDGTRLKIAQMLGFAKEQADLISQAVLLSAEQL